MTKNFGTGIISLDELKTNNKSEGSINIYSRNNKDKVKAKLEVILIKIFKYGVYTREPMDAKNTELETIQIV